MKALLIDPDRRAIAEVDISSHEDIVKLIGFDTIASDEVGKQGDRLYFDEDCFVRGSSGRFQLDHLAPVAGKAIIIGGSEGGSALCDVSTTTDSLSSRLKYL